MTTPIDVHPRSPKHCGAVLNLRVRSNVYRAERSYTSFVVKPCLVHKHRVTLYIGEVAASISPVVLETVLGSCVAVCLHDSILRIGGMNHILLPECRVGDRSPTCGVHAMELLINELMKLGADRRRLVAKAFGGANVLRGVAIFPVGGKNAGFVREFLATERIPLIGERLGGDHAVRVSFQTETGKATVYTIDGSQLPIVLRRERTYCKPALVDKSFDGEITLF